MAETKGRIDNINVFDGFCCVRVLETAGGDSTTVLLWSYFAQAPSAADRLLHGQFLSLTRDALTHNRIVTFNHPDDSAIITSMMVE